MKKLVLAAGLLLGTSLTAYSHGAAEYLHLNSYEYEEKGNASFYIRYDYTAAQQNDAGFDRWEITPGFSYALINGLCFDSHMHFAKFGQKHLLDEERDNFEPLGPPPFIEAAAFSLQYSFPLRTPLDVAFSAGYEMPFKRAEDILGGEEVFTGALILGRDFGSHSNVSLNIMAEIEDGESEMGWGSGVKTPLSKDPHGIAGGIEVFSSFEDIENDFSVLPGIYMPVGYEGTVFKSGIEFGKDFLGFSAELLYEF